MVEIIDIEYAVNQLIKRIDQAAKEAVSAQVRVHAGDKNSGKDALWAVHFIGESKEYKALEDMFKT